MKIHESISLDKNSEEPMYIQLYENIKNLIDNRTIKSGEKLPAIRAMAEKIGVNNVTVVNAYRLLEQKGYVYSKVGSGTFVKDFSKNENAVNYMVDSEQEFVKINQNQINLSTSTPSPSLFPVGDFKEVLNEVLDRDGGYAFSYQESQGYHPLRQSICSYIGEKGINSDVKDISIISGAQQGIDIIAKTLVGFNDVIIVESPTYTGALAAFKSRGAKMIEVPIKEDGIDTGELEEILKSTNVKLIYVMTNFQNPTGISYSQDKKLQLIYLAQKYNTFILEDDYLSDLRFYGENIMPIKSIDAGNKVIYLKSFSKIFMPGIRLGFLITPGSITRSVMSAKHNTDISTSDFMQRAFDLYLRKRKWQKHVDRMLQTYKKRYDTIIKVLKEETPFLHFSQPDGGMHIWAHSDMDSLILCSAAKQKGVIITPGKIFYLDDRNSNNIRISFAGVDEDEIIKGVKLIKDAYNEVQNYNSGNILPIL